ncbi:MAG TPA: response regulator [Cyclobacteriaceae bacterium]|nr:response regulator [Cyclobacteriaceae bacterium]
MKKRILVIDDSYYMRTLLRNILEDGGYTVVDEAASGESALKLVNKTKPDLITLDLILPDDTGLKVLKKIKAAHPQIKVLVVSAVAQDKIVKEALELGAINYIVKPFEEKKVLESVNEIFNENKP